MDEKIAIGIIEDLEKSLEDNGIIAQAPEIKEALTMSIEALKGGEVRPKGELTYHTDGYIAFYTCSKCNGFGDIQDKFCKHCGADMRKGGEE